MRRATCHPDRIHFAKGLCNRCYAKAWAANQYAKNPKYKQYIREHHLKTTYGITQDDYNRILAKQGGVCKLCGSDRGIGHNALGVDHSHKTGRVRGILCKFCNSKLGWFENRRPQIEEYLKEAE